MPREILSTSAEAARRLTVTKQHLAGSLRRKGTKGDIVSVIRDLPFVQWDPVTIVAPSHIISLWSRLGKFSTSDLDELLWVDKKLFLHWTPIAFLVLTEDYPLYASLMARYPESMNSWGAQGRRAKEFLAGHEDLRRRMLKELERGPLLASQFGGYVRSRSKDGWSSENDVSNMLFHLHMAGKVMVVARDGNQNVWGLTEGFLPRRARAEPLSEQEFERQAAQKAIRALGTATASEISYYFVPGRYQSLRKTLAELQDDSVIHRIAVEGFGKREERYIHDGDVRLLDKLQGGAWQPRVSLVAPFDNLIRGRERTRTVFGFDYAHEQFLPKEKRRYGTYVLPILWGANLIGRAVLRTDRDNKKLVVNSVHAEPGAPAGREVPSEIGTKFEDLASFLGAKGVEYGASVPPDWRGSFRPTVRE